VRSSQCAAELFEFRILGLGGDEDGNVGIGIFPQAKEILIGGAGLRRVALLNVDAGKSKMRESASRTIPQQPAMVEDFLEFGCRELSLLRRQVSLSADVHGIQTGVSSAHS
jgi:hypothetical protein